MNIHELIVQKLKETEREYDMKIVYAVESGSRGWGFASTDSDYDCRFIYVHKKDWYLSIDEKKDFIEYPVDEVFDVNGWDLRKALKLLRKSNPPLLEWFSSPIVYMEDTAVTDDMRKLGAEFFDTAPALYHYLHIAKKHFEEVTGTAKLKKYFYILRPIIACKWIERFKTMPPMEYHKMLDAVPLEDAVRSAMDKLMVLKLQSDEKTLVERNHVIMDFCEAEIAYFTEYLKHNHKQHNQNSEVLDEFFCKCVKEVSV